MPAFDQNDLEISVTQVRDLLSKQDACLVDVRRLDEYEAEHIPGSIHCPMDQITVEHIRSLVKEGQVLVLHCQAGVRSMKTLQQLVDHGYHQPIYSMKGGLLGWLSDDPVQK